MTNPEVTWMFNKDVDHTVYRFRTRASVKMFTKIQLIPEHERYLYKFCELCNICYPQRTFSNHKKNKLHKKQFDELLDAYDKAQEEFDLNTTINQRLEAELKLSKNDRQIAPIICQYLKDSCCDCQQETVNPANFIRNGTAVNLCQHCRKKYEKCFFSSCNSLLFKQTCERCDVCKKLGCSQHLKRLQKNSKKVFCAECMHIKADELSGNYVFKKLKQKHRESARKARYLQMENDQLKENVRNLSRRVIELQSDLK